MSSERFTLRLRGCRPEPLAHYLKALGILRLVAEQVDPQARGSWQNDEFVLTSTLDREGLVAFFTDAYVPTPIVSPWNGASGYYLREDKKTKQRTVETTSTQTLQTLMSSECQRFAPLRETALLATSIVQKNASGAAQKGPEKARLLAILRGCLPDAAIMWLDSSILGGGDGESMAFPPLLGTGGGDGALDFSSNFHQRLLEMFDARTGEYRLSRSLLRQSVFDDVCDGLSSQAKIGQFLPGGAGGSNAGTGYDGKSQVNAWDFVLMLEGALMLGATAARRLEQTSRGILSFPFTVRSSAAGYGSAASNEGGTDSRGEIWLPLWETPATAGSLKAIFSEGRARVGKRAAKNGIDFAQAVATLGVDRGIQSFSRFGFHVRNGLSYFATPLGRFRVQADPRVDVLQSIGPWLERLRGKAGGDRAPGSVQRAMRNVDEAILELCQHSDPSRMLDLFVQLGQVHDALFHARGWAKDAYLTSIPRFDANGWLQHLPDCVELRLALAVASVGKWSTRGYDTPIHTNVWPVSVRRKTLGLEDGASPEMVWGHHSPVDALLAVMQRRVQAAVQHGARFWQETATVTASLSDVAAFEEGRTNDPLLQRLIASCLLLNLTENSLPRTADDVAPSAGYAMLKLCFAGHPVREVEVPLTARLLALVAAGRDADALAVGHRRLRASGLPPLVRLGRLAQPRRAAAALLFPIDRVAIGRLSRQLLGPSSTAARPEPVPALF